MYSLQAGIKDNPSKIDSDDRFDGVIIEGYG